MNLNDSACHPGDGTKELNRLPYQAEPLLRFDLQQRASKPSARRFVGP
jgi:hypothetical protein